MNIGQWVHLSVDDVILCFKWIFEQKPESIFEEPMLGKIKQWHDKYRLNCDLYVFEQCEGFSLNQLQDCYWKELYKESHWLKIAWHAPDSGTDMRNIKAKTNKEKEVLTSLEQVYDLITKKVGKQAWSDTTRLHLWTAPESVLLSLYEKGTNILLTADRESISYHLNKDDLELLSLQGSIWIKPFTYRVTDIRFDQLDEGISVQDLLDRSEKCLKKYLMKPYLEVFVHEWKFKNIILDMDTYLERFGEICLPLIVDAGVTVGRTFYFTTYNTCGLYTFNLVSKEIKLLTILPCKDWNLWKFIGLYHYQGTIWMIPWSEDKIVTYHLTSGKIVFYHMPFLDNRNIWLSKFRNVIVDGRFLWLLPSVTKKIVRIDMMQHSFKTYFDWPQEMLFSSNKGVNFLMMCQQGRKLYLLKQSASHNVIFDMDTGEMIAWGDQLPVAFGIVVENELIFSPRENGESVCIYNMNTGEKNNYFLPDWIWDSKNINSSHAFWYVKQVENIIYIFPHDANILLLYDLEEKSLKWIELDILDYRMLNGENYKGISDMWIIDSKLYFVSFLNNILIETDIKGNILEYISLDVSIKSLPNVRVKKFNIKTENEDNFLEDFLFQIVNWKIGRWKELENCITQIDFKKNCTGELIYNAVKEKI